MAMCFSEPWEPGRRIEPDPARLERDRKLAEESQRAIENRIKFLNGAPDFQVREERVVNGRSILLVHYEGCPTFNGMKLMLLKRRYWPGECLDPHLLGEDYMIMARFEPNEMGWRLATACAEMIRL